MKILITSGGTRVPIDSVRYIGNVSTGRYGAELARVCSDRKHDVYMLAAKGSVLPKNSTGVTIEEYTSLDEYTAKSQKMVDTISPDIVISAAAVSDYRMEPFEGKVSSSSELVLKLTRAQKVLPLLKRENNLLVGFKLLVSPKFEEVYDAVAKVLDNGADLVIYNDLTRIKNGDSTRIVFDKRMRIKTYLYASGLITNLENEYLMKTSKKKS